jgi:hypothetical protein
MCIERGPLVYCLEAIDQRPDVDLLDIVVSPETTMSSAWQADLLGGVATVTVPAEIATQGDWEGQLYLPAGARAGASQQVELTAIPYYAWANRGTGTMRVWLPRSLGQM